MFEVDNQDQRRSAERNVDIVEGDDSYYNLPLDFHGLSTGKCGGNDRGDQNQSLLVKEQECVEFINCQYTLAV